MGAKKANLNGMAVIYCRVSTDEQTKGLSLSAQEAVCRKWCKREGIAVDRVFVDRGVSAKTDEREEFQAMIAYCRSAGGDISHVVVYRVDRFSRIAHHVGLYRALLMAVGCRLISATENLADDPAGKLLGTILAGFAEYDNDQKAERVKASMRMLVQNGYWVSRPPFGYAIERVENRPQLVPHPTTGPVMRMVFEKIASGEWSPSEAWQAIADTGHKLSESRFYEVLRDPIYAGLIDNSMSNGAVHAKGRPLVSLDVFTTAQATLEARERIMRRVSDFPLRGVLVCPACGRRMTASVSTGRGGRAYAYYHCTTGDYRIPVRRVHEAVPSLIDQIGRRIAPLVALLRAYMQIAIKDEMGDVRAVADACKSKLASLENKRQRLLDAYLAATINRESFCTKDVELQDQIGFQRARMAEADYDVQEAEQILLGSERILADLPAMWARMDGEQRHDLFHALFGDDGLTWTGTPADVEQSHLVRLVARFDEVRLAPPTGFEPVLPG